MVTIDIHGAGINLSHLIDRAEAGEDVVIARAGKPVVRLIRIETSVDTGPRQSGMFPGLIVPESFFEPLSEKELSAWK